MWKGKRLYALIMTIATVSFAGFWIEDIWMSMIQKHMDNRNMCLPFLLGYGLAVAAIYGIFGRPGQMRFFKKPVRLKSRFLQWLLYYALMTLTVTAGELALGTTVELLTGNIWWDYRNMPLHFTPYISLYTSLGLGFALTVAMELFMPLIRFFEKWNAAPLRLCAIILAVALTADYLFSMGYMLLHHQGIFLWRIYF